MKPKESRFKVNFKGILDILSKHLYSSEEVFLRELLQNSKDAITLRKLSTTDFSQGQIQIEFVHTDDKSVLIFEDNGNGLTLPEVEQFLSVIGSSSKKDIANLQMNDQNFVGQFGIGLLSCFMVSDKITLLSKSAKSEKAVKWEASIDGTYQAAELDNSSMDVGTKIFLELSHEKSKVYTSSYITNLLTKYSQFLGIQVSFIEQNESNFIPKKEFPWTKSNTSMAILEFGRSYFNIPFRHYIPLESTDGKSIGVGYIYPYSSKPGSQQAHHIYIKNMLIDEQCTDILPEWAFFVKAVINSEVLRPTASREGIYKDKTLEHTRIDFEKSIRSYFAQLADNAPSILEEVISTHQLAVKAFAVEDDDFFNLIEDFLSFPTSQGNMKVKDLKLEKDTIQYVENIDHFRQMLPIAKANDQLVVNTGYIYDTSLVKKLEQRYPSQFHSISDLRFTSILKDLTWDEDNEFSVFQDRCNQVLVEHKAEAVLKKFQPVTLPAMFHLTNEQNFSRDVDRTKDVVDDVWGGMLDDLMSPKKTQIKKSSLYLNMDNPLILKISNINQDKLFRQCVELIYVNALLLGHYSLNEKETHILNNNLIALIDLIA